MAVTAEEGPQIFQYLDYRIFLEHFFAHRKTMDPEFSLRIFARSPGLALSSSSFISAVIKGRKNLSQSLRLRFGRAMGLQSAEMEYFESLIQFNQSKSAEERNHYRAQLARFHGARERQLHEAQQRFYSRWYYGAVWHYIGLRQDHASPARIAKNIFPPLKPEQAEEAIRVLLELKLIKKLANGYAVNDRHFAAGRGYAGETARHHQREFMRLGLERLESARVPEGRYHVSSFAISRRGLARVQERIDALRAEVRELTESDEGGDDRVYALSLQLFPCSSDEGGEPKPPKSGARARPGTSSDAGISAI